MPNYDEFGSDDDDESFEFMGVVQTQEVQEVFVAEDGKEKKTGATAETTTATDEIQSDGKVQASGGEAKPAISSRRDRWVKHADETESEEEEMSSLRDWRHPWADLAQYGNKILRWRRVQGERRPMYGKLSMRKMKDLLLSRGQSDMGNRKDILCRRLEYGDKRVLEVAKTMRADEKECKEETESDVDEFIEKMVAVHRQSCKEKAASHQATIDNSGLAEKIDVDEAVVETASVEEQHVTMSPDKDAVKMFPQVDSPAKVQEDVKGVKTSPSRSEPADSKMKDTTQSTASNAAPTSSAATAEPPGNDQAKPVAKSTASEASAAQGNGTFVVEGKTGSTTVDVEMTASTTASAPPAITPAANQSDKTSSVPFRFGQNPSTAQTPATYASAAATTPFVFKPVPTAVPLSKSPALTSLNIHHPQALVLRLKPSCRRPPHPYQVVFSTFDQRGTSVPMGKQTLFRFLFRPLAIWEDTSSGHYL